jgi:lysine/arginine/ornithine transport system substrate-binding protein
MNAVYRSYFQPERLPARTTFAGKLVQDARVEVECVAVAAR